MRPAEQGFYCDWFHRPTFPSMTRHRPALRQKFNSNFIGLFLCVKPYPTRAGHRAALLHLAPLAGRGRRACAPGEGDSPRVQTCVKRPSPRPSPRKSGAREKKRHPSPLIPAPAGLVPATPVRKEQYPPNRGGRTDPRIRSRPAMTLWVKKPMRRCGRNEARARPGAQRSLVAIPCSMSPQSSPPRSRPRC
jgi:hypothetical protein